MAEMMSVPPVLPPCRKTIPMPMPSSKAPMTHAMKPWSSRNMGRRSLFNV